jgi:hypothetical protein
MATILEIRQQNNDNIRAKTAPGTILKGDDANMRDTVANELRDRGIITVTSTSYLSDLSHENTQQVFVEYLGLFISYESGDSADNILTFASADSGWLWKKVLETSALLREKLTATTDLDYTLLGGLMAFKFLFNPTEAMTIKMGTTNGGEEIMPATDLEANKWYSFSYDVLTDGSDVHVYINGITNTITIILLKTQL